MEEWLGDMECAGRWDRGREAALGPRAARWLLGGGYNHTTGTAPCPANPVAQTGASLGSPRTLPEHCPRDYDTQRSRREH